MQVCEATLAENSWQMLTTIPSLSESGRLRKEFDTFMH
jgi:hypothetical protein